MALRYVDVQNTGLQPRSLELADTILGRRQRRWDTSVAAREQALQEALSKGYVDPVARQQYIDRANQRFDEVSQKYKGDLSSGRDEMLSAVTDVRTDSYIQANKAQLEALQLENQLAAKIGPEYSYLKSSVADTPLYDESTGQYRTKFQPQVYDLRNLAKLAGAEGQGISARNIGRWRSTGDGYQERMIGYDTQEAERFMQNEGQEYLNNILASQGLDPSDPRARQIASEAMFTSLIGKPETRADRSLDMEIKRMQLAKSGSPRVSLDEPTMSTIGRKPVFMRTESEKDLFKQEKDVINQITPNQRTMNNLLEAKENTASKLKDLQERIDLANRKEQEGAWSKRVADNLIKNYIEQMQGLSTALSNQDKALELLKNKGVKPFTPKTKITKKEIPEEYKDIYNSLEQIEGIGDDAGEYLQNTLTLANELTQPNLYFEQDTKKRDDLIKTINAQSAVGQSKFYPVEFDEEDGYIKEDDSKTYKDIEGNITEVSFSPYNGAVIVTDGKKNQYELDRTSLGKAGNIAKLSEEATNFYKNPKLKTKSLQGDIGNIKNITLTNIPDPRTKSLIPVVTVDYYDGTQWKKGVNLKYDSFMNYLGEQMFKQLTTKR